jgi:aryl-alcohol dehydrogenase-like predicted oxidoreductase
VEFYTYQNPTPHIWSTIGTKTVKTLPFGDIEVPVPGFGAMGLNSSMGTDLNYEESEPVLQEAIDLGCTFWDTAVSFTI